MRRTAAQVQVAAALLANADGQHWGYDLGKETGVRSGVLYPMLTRWLDEGYLTDGWEDPAEISGRPPRRYYELTSSGRQALASLLAARPAPSVQQASSTRPAAGGAFGRVLGWGRA